MSGFTFFASPWWVNLLVFVPVIPYLLSRKAKFTLGRKRLLVVAVFGVAFGFVEAAVVVYLRAATGLWPVPQAHGPAALPENLVRIECFREAATLVMLGGIAWLAGQKFKAKVAAFLFAFAFWDFFITSGFVSPSAGPARSSAPTSSSSFPCRGSRRDGFPS